jgi:predicted regulator of amino acid metabolism with ACT domain
VDAPVAERAAGLAATISAVLADHGFTVRQVVTRDHGRSPAVCVIAGAPSP